jgi:hypothetical protein
MAEAKTKATRLSVSKYLDGIADDARRADCEAIAALMKSITKQEPAMWGASIVGYGKYAYVYDSGRSGEFCATGFSSRKGDISSSPNRRRVHGAGALRGLRRAGRHRAVASPKPSPTRRPARACGEPGNIDVLVPTCDSSAPRRRSRSPKPSGARSSPPWWTRCRGWCAPSRRP